MGTGLGGVAVESHPIIRGPMGGQSLAWAGGLLCCALGGVSSLPLSPCSEEVARYEK